MTSATHSRRTINRSPTPVTSRYDSRAVALEQTIPPTERTNRDADHQSNGTQIVLVKTCRIGTTRAPFVAVQRSHTENDTDSAFPDDRGGAKTAANPYLR